MHSVFLFAVLIFVLVAKHFQANSNQKTISVNLNYYQVIRVNKALALGNTSTHTEPPSPYVFDDPLDRLLISWDDMTQVERMKALSRLGLPVTTTLHQLFQLPRTSHSSDGWQCRYPA